MRVLGKDWPSALGMSLKGVFFLSQKVFFVRSSESFINVNILCDLL